MVLDEYGVQDPCATKADFLMALNRFLIQRLEKNEPVLLIVDEAQNLTAELLEEIRLLSNLETPTSKLIQIMLVGQPELRAMLARPDLRQLRQRIVLRHHLRPFDAEECDAYVQERLRLAGHTGKEVFDRAALREIFTLTGGVPRLVNALCDGALLLGFARDRKTLGRAEIREAARDLDLISEGAPAPTAAAPLPNPPRPQRRGLLARFRRRG
jgi:general secretion pathway protein A